MPIYLCLGLRKRFLKILTSDPFLSFEPIYQYLNSFHPTIKFTMEFSKEQINFVDVNSSPKEGALQTELYCKSTDTHQFLPFQILSSLCLQKVNPCGQAIRMKRICHNEEELSSRIENLEHWVCSRGHKKRFIVRSKKLTL